MSMGEGMGAAMEIRKTTKEDLEEVLLIYAYAREQMKKNGNPLQWGDSRPSEAAVVRDIEGGNSYVVENGGKICGVFSFIIGEEPTYQVIENGEWKNNDSYGTLHRLASDGTKKGVFQACLAYCESRMPNVRADTHKDNLIMQHLLEKYGYEKCGTIYVEDGSPRIAYQKS